MSRWLSYAFVFLTILGTVYGQVVIKWQVMKYGAMPADAAARLKFIGVLLLNPWIVSALLASFVAALVWMLALAALPLSHAYPFISLSFVILLVLSNVFFMEPITMFKVFGVSLIIAGVIINSQ